MEKLAKNTIKMNYYFYIVLKTILKTYMYIYTHIIFLIKKTLSLHQKEKEKEKVWIGFGDLLCCTRGLN